MKKLIILFLLPMYISAQEKVMLDVVSGEDLGNRVSTGMQYVFQDFTKGEVHFKNGRKNSSMLNYNMLLGEMQFLDNEEILSLLTLKDIQMIIINNRKFFPYNNSEFCEELHMTGDVRLCVKRNARPLEQSKVGAMGIETSTRSSTTYNSIDNNSGVRNDLEVQRKILVSTKDTYYLMNKGKYYQIKNQKSFTKLFPVHSAKIEAYVIEQDTDFKNEEDLEALIAYCSNL